MECKKYALEHNFVQAFHDYYINCGFWAIFRILRKNFADFHTDFGSGYSKPDEIFENFGKNRRQQVQNAVLCKPCLTGGGK
jgi:hypothetical protein